MSKEFDLDGFLAHVRSWVDAALEERLRGNGDDPGRLREAMRYAVLAGGKRLRPALVLAAARAVGGAALDDGRALPAAVAVELLHAYTLVHDDLPAMDDDDVRRGRPTVHIAFGEATAILAGDALLTEAMGALAGLGPAAAAGLLVLSTRAGARALLAGQARDLATAEQPPGDLAELEQIHAGKTGALFAAAAELGAIAAGADGDGRRRLGEYGMALGVAFQHADDLADGDHPSLAGAARRRVVELTEQASAIARTYGEHGAALVALCQRVRDLKASGEPR